MIGFMRSNEEIKDQELEMEEPVVDDWERAKETLKTHATGFARHFSYWFCLVSEILGFVTIIRILIKILFKKK